MPLWINVVPTVLLTRHFQVQLDTGNTLLEL